MRKTRKLLAITLMLVLALGMMAGCAPDSDTPSTAPSTAPAGNNSTAPEAEVAWPGKQSVQIIVPYGAGGDTDFNARTLAEKLGDYTGGNFVVVNVNGNGGATGSLQVMDSDPDGNTMLFHNVGMLINQAVGVADFGIEAFDLCAITGLNPGQIIAMLPDRGITSLDELKAYTQEHPGELTISANTGGSTQIDALMLIADGFDLTMVDAGGSADRVSALLGEHVDVIINSYGTIKDYLETGEIIPLALDAVVQPDSIDIPTAASLGYNVGLQFNYFMAFPKGTDPAIVAKCSETLEEIITTDAEYAQKIADAYKQSPVYYNAEDGLKLLEDTYEELSKLDYSK